ncbi:MAG: helix-turn-helix transcriptional regulator [Clostridia bacterium]|jgi:transcriptional regulator with XRE-family HTH domain|nr:helix-turn-helix transcriptional regulator [Clostridia bacterium]
MITLQQIHNKLAYYIQTGHITQKELAERLHIKPPTVSQYVKGRAMPALDTFANLCKVLDIDANDVLCLDDDKD